ncbi:MAG: hypothetical protein MUF87_12295 [Anaerolineae bacterium]|jgi:hypothetical protein|nr:hypothetical protein [Anaerolineae bacterium]
MLQTAEYLLLGLGLSAVIMALFIGSYLIRYRNLQQDLTMIERLQEDEHETTDFEKAKRAE